MINKFIFIVAIPQTNPGIELFKFIKDISTVIILSNCSFLCKNEICKNLNTKKLHKSNKDNIRIS